jgi:hypothetical protein
LLPTGFVNGRMLADAFGEPAAIQEALKPSDMPD